ncbi:MAG: type II toxin-antitoxin system death-on-curing family toxin [Patescibacteria group bacterium]
MSKVIFLTSEQVITIHYDQIERYGGSHGIASIPLMESAIMRPQSTFSGKDLYPSIFDKTAAMVHSIIMNHAFVDGNKRTATTCGIVFLQLNGYVLEVGHEKLIENVLKVRHEELNIKQLSAWMQINSRKI